MKNVTLDFTGLYYEIVIDLDALGPNPTVQEVTEAAVGKVGTTGGKLLRADFSDNGFLTEAEVSFVTTDPQSRQIKSGSPFPAGLPRGVYGFRDDTSSAVPGIDKSFTLAWQYYVFRSRELQSGSSDTTARTIVPAGGSAAATPLQENDLIRWRLVAIGGLSEVSEEMQESLTTEQRAELTERILEKKLTTREVLKEIGEISK